MCVFSFALVRLPSLQAPRRVCGWGNDGRVERRERRRKRRERREEEIFGKRGEKEKKLRERASMTARRGGEKDMEERETIEERREEQIGFLLFCIFEENK